jgi:hypothetical protein
MEVYMNKTKQNIAILSIVLLSLGGLIIYNNNQATQPAESSLKTVDQSVQPTNSEISFSEDRKIVSYEGVTGMTALEILKNLTNVTTEDSSFGEFVTSINGLEAINNKEYWSFFVNGEYANEGAGTYKTTDGENLEWRLEEL